MAQIRIQPNSLPCWMPAFAGMTGSHHFMQQRRLHPWFIFYNHTYKPMKVYRCSALATAGFTLVELLAVLAISAILLTLAVPAYQHLLTYSRTTAQLNTLVTGLSYARSEAISRNEKLLFCKSANHKSCGGNWRDGQILVDAQKQVLRIFPGLSSNEDLVWSSSGSDLNDGIVWLATGYTNGQRGTFYYCVGNNSREKSRNIVVLDTGRWYVMPMSVTDYSVHCFK